MVTFSSGWLMDSPDDAICWGGEKRLGSFNPPPLDTAV
jgi:hypothetical protein